MDDLSYHWLIWYLGRWGQISWTVQKFGVTDCRYLLKHGANVAAVNNDGDLAIDIAEDEEMENLLQEEMDKKGMFTLLYLFGFFFGWGRVVVVGRASN